MKRDTVLSSSGEVARISLTRETSWRYISGFRGYGIPPCEAGRDSISGGFVVAECKIIASGMGVGG